jgi:hypothetical protein
MCKIHAAVTRLLDFLPLVIQTTFGFKRMFHGAAARRRRIYLYSIIL